MTQHLGDSGVNSAKILIIQKRRRNDILLRDIHQIAENTRVRCALRRSDASINLETIFLFVQTSNFNESSY